MSFAGEDVAATVNSVATRSENVAHLALDSHNQRVEMIEELQASLVMHRGEEGHEDKGELVLQRRTNGNGMVVSTFGRAEKARARQREEWRVHVTSKM